MDGKLGVNTLHRYSFLCDTIPISFLSYIHNSYISFAETYSTEHSPCTKLRYSYISLIYKSKSKAQSEVEKKKTLQKRGMGGGGGGGGEGVGGK
jgi:hypothetical protein